MGVCWMGTYQVVKGMGPRWMGTKPGLACAHYLDHSDHSVHSVIITVLGPKPLRDRAGSGPQLDQTL